MRTVTVLLSALCLALGVAIAQAPAQNQHQYPFQNPNLSTEERVTNIISLLTPEEKVDVLGANYYLGGRNGPPPSLTRLGIRGYNQGEGLHGLARGRADNLNAVPTTTFIQSIGLGETWDPDLLQKAAAIESYEARWLNQTQKYSRGGSQFLIIRAPNADLGRDIRWGRNEECYGEDAFLNGMLTAAFVRGLQGNDPKYWQTAALLKHFLANSNENGRMRTSSDFDERLLREYYSVPFRMGVEAGARSYMAAYNGMNGIPMTAHPILSDIEGHHHQGMGGEPLRRTSSGISRPFECVLLKGWPSGYRRSVTVSVGRKPDGERHPPNLKAQIAYRRSQYGEKSR